MIVRPFRRRHVARALRGSLAGLLTLAPPASAMTFDVAWSDGWLPADAPLTLRVDAPAAAEMARLRFFVGTADVTALVRRPAPDQVVLEPLAAGWQAGEHVFVVWHVVDGDWREVQRAALRVRTPAGLDRSDTQRTGELQLLARVAEDRDDGQPASPRGTTQDLTGRAGLTWTGSRGAWQGQAKLNTTGASFRGAALRHAQLADRAPKVDLADWQLTWQNGDHALEAGHVQWGLHPLLVNGLATRGLTARTRLSPWLDLGASALHGKPLAGYDNLLGLAQAGQRSHGLTLGVELLPERPGGLRAELTWLDARQRPEPGFEVGEVGDTEESRGVGLRLLGRSAGGRVRGELALARSRFTNPFDPLLETSQGLRPVAPATAPAWLVDVQVDLLQQAEVGAQRLDVGVGLRHERAAPLYRSIGAQVVADQSLTRLQGRAAVAGAELSAQVARRADNLDRIASVLANQTDERSVSMRVPLEPWFGEAGAPAPRWPTLALTWQQVHQRAASTPSTADSGIAATHRPDQHNQSLQFDVAWVVGPASLAYGLARSAQDNRQVGREQADFHTLGHRVSGSGPLSDAWRVNLELHRSRQRSVEEQRTRRTTGASFGLEGDLHEQVTLAAQLAQTLADDSTGQTLARSTTAHLQTTWRFTLPGPGPSLPAQAHLRLGAQGDTNRDATFGVASRWRAWWLDIGLSVNLP